MSEELYLVEDWTTHSVTLGDGTELGYFRKGVDHAKTMLFLNGALGSGEKDSARFLLNFASHVNCISIDMRGYGLSKNTERVFSANQFHQDATDAAEVMKILGFRKYSVYGMSDGGNTAIILAAQDCECVESVVLMGAQMHLTEEIMAYYEGMTNLRTWHPIQIEPKLECYGKEATIEMLRKNHESHVEIFEKRNGEICVAEAKKVKCPVLIVHPEFDEFHGGIENAESLANNIPNSTLHVFPDLDTGTLLMEHFLKLKKLMIDFINKNEST